MVFGVKARLTAEIETTEKTKLRQVTPAYAQLAADVHFAGVAPAFTLSLGDSERSRKPPNAHSLGR